jgi:DWNN domain
MSSVVHYRMKTSARGGWERITFEGPVISVLDLKRAVVRQKHMEKSPDNFDLTVTNFQSGEGMYLTLRLYILKQYSSMCVCVCVCVRVCVLCVRVVLCVCVYMYVMHTWAGVASSAVCDTRRALFSEERPQIYHQTTQKT